jgi:hypothetical protein
MKSTDTTCSGIGKFRFMKNTIPLPSAKMKIHAFLTGVICLFMTASYVAAASLYVSPSGNDSNAGDEGNPLGSLKEAIRKANEGGIEEIILTEGVYPLLNVDITRPTTEGAAKPLVIRAAKNKDGQFANVVFDSSKLILAQDVTEVSPGVYTSADSSIYQKDFPGMWHRDPQG